VHITQIQIRIKAKRTVALVRHTGQRARMPYGSKKATAGLDAEGLGCAGNGLLLLKQYS